MQSVMMLSELYLTIYSTINFNLPKYLNRQNRPITLAKLDNNHKGYKNL